MTKSLRKRFIFFTMAAVSCLLLFIVIALNGLNWMMLERQSDMVMKILVDSNGAFQKMDFNQPPPFIRPLDMDRMRSSRFFIVRSDADGNVREVNTDQIFSIDRETAENYALAVWQTGRTSGRIDGYKFAVKDLGPNRLLFFMDTSGQSESFYMVLFVSAAIAVLCWLILLIIVSLLSGKVIRPVIAGMEKQKQFITNAGHEMKTPLAIIQSNNDTMALIHGEPNTMSIYTDRATEWLMSNLLLLARLDESPPPAEPVNISELAAELLPAYQEAALVRSLRFHVQIEPGLRLLIEKASFQQLLTILLDNAVKYTPDGGQISLRLTRHGRRISMIQENSCEASHEADTEILFERFYRGDPARTQRAESSGYGIGLSAARARCERFNGKLTATYTSAESIRFVASF